MKKKSIWVHTLVKNEGKFVWFAVKSVIDDVDKMLIWDTGSIDDTVKIIQTLQNEYPKKILFKQISEINAKGITEARQQMLKLTKSDWFLILDGDEVWWRDSIKKVVQTINDHLDINAIVVPTINVVGDIYHYQEETAGRYQFLGKKGHMNMRVINRKVPGLHIKGDYPLEGFYDQNDKLLQQDNVKFINAPLLHLTHLERSSVSGGDQNTLQRKRKMKYELGVPFPKDFKYPEVFYLNRPEFVPLPWVRMGYKYKLRAALETPLKKIKRRITK